MDQTIDHMDEGKHMLNICHRTNADYMKLFEYWTLGTYNPGNTAMLPLYACGINPALFSITSLDQRGRRKLKRKV